MGKRIPSIAASIATMRALGSPWVGGAVIAVAGAIGLAFVDERAAELTLDEVSVTVRAKRDSGSPWDFGGGLPDPVVRVEQAGRVLASCPEARDRLEVRCPVNARLARDAGAVRVIVVDKDSADDDVIGELALVLPARGRATQPGPGALASVDVATRDGGRRLARLVPLWIGLGAGVLIALGLFVVRRR